VIVAHLSQYSRLDSRMAHPTALLFVSLSLLLSLPSHGQRVAILSDPVSEPLAALLTAELSKVKNLVLVERAELEKVQQEQQLTAGGSVRLARLLSAEGVIVLENATVEKQAATSARLVAADPGVVIGGGVFDGDPAAAVHAMVERFKPLWPKLAVRRGAAVPISILNLRAAVTGSEALERQLTFLVGRQLMQQPELFVLERWRMGDLAWEKSMATTEGEAFWSGSYLMDGAVEQIDAQGIKLRLSLRPPGGGVVQTFELAGPADGLADLAARAAAQLAARVVKQPRLLPWQPLDEARIYLQEARWAWRARLYAAARAGSDAAWALGNREPACAILRVKIHSEAVYPEFHDTGGQMYRYEPANFPASEIPGRARQALEALRIHREELLPVAGLIKPNDEPPSLAGATALLAGSRLMRYCYEHRFHEGEHASLLAELRAALRATAAATMARKQTYPDSDGQIHVHLLATIYSAYWQETPEDVLAVWRERRSWQPAAPWTVRRYVSSLRQAMVSHGITVFKDRDPIQIARLVAWHGEKPVALEAQWQGFVDSLIASENAIDVLDGYLLRLGEQTTAEKGEAVMAQIYAAMEKHREALLRENMTGVYVDAIVNDYLNTYRFDFDPVFAKKLLLVYLELGGDDDDRAVRSLFEAVWRAKSLSLSDAQEIYARWVPWKARLAAGGRGEFEQRRYAPLESDLLSRFPELATKEFHGLEVKQFWSIPELAQTSVTRFGFSHATWDGRHLWFAVSFHPNQVYSHNQIYRIDLPTLAVSQQIAIPQTPLLNLSSTVQNDTFEVHPETLFIFHSGKTLRYDQTTSLWQTPSFPGYRSFSLGGDLYTAAGEGFCRIPAGSETGELLAGPRRKPAQSELDDCQSWRVDAFFPASRGRVGLAVQGRVYLYDPATKKFERILGEAFWTYPVSTPLYTLLAAQNHGLAVVDHTRDNELEWFGNRARSPMRLVLPPRRSRT
jgi:hypothetical protein